MVEKTETLQVLIYKGSIQILSRLSKVIDPSLHAHCAQTKKAYGQHELN